MQRLLRRFLYVMFPLCLLFPSPAHPQAPPGPEIQNRTRTLPSSSDVGIIEANSTLVLIPAHVTRPDGAPVTGLRKSNFRILENNVEQRIANFTEEDAPVSVGFLLDTSGSMRSKMLEAVKAASAFFRTANPQDEFFLVEFSDRAKLCIPFTPFVEEVTDRIARTHPFGKTSLLDAIHLALHAMKEAHNGHKALVVVSDGGDNWSRHSASEIKNELRESDVQLYAMGIFGEPNGKITPEEEKNGPLLLDELAEQSGGRHYRVDQIKDLPQISSRIGNELRTVYMLGYYPEPGAQDGKFHLVNVQLQGSESVTQLRTYYRRGYYAPVRYQAFTSGNPK